MKHELLAPAGNIEAGYAALYYGADAVYLGLNRFSARAGAENFTPEELDTFTAYAHSMGRKVFVALNTILTEAEVEELPAVFQAIDKAKVDALIIQDLGVFYLAKRLLPEVELHASTQMAVHNAEGAKYLQSLGFKRVVLARELSYEEIKAIAEATPGLDLEVFVHGALCYSYSGQCLFSALEYGKSANRGRCVYPCRNVYDMAEEGETHGGAVQAHLFSMKDLALEENVLKIPALSLKIEGRKKSPLYVAAVTNYYRHILDGKKKNPAEADDIKQIFSRPWCSFHFNGKDKAVVDEHFVGHRGLLIGQVVKIAHNRLVFKTTHTVARYDGVQIDVKGDEKPFGFGIKELFVNKKAVFEAPAGTMVEVELPAERPLFEVGAPVYLASASAVKGRYGYQKPKPKAFVNAYPLDVAVEVSAHAVWAMCGETAVSVEGHFEAAKDVAKVQAAADAAFAKTGGTEFMVTALRFHNPLGLFVPVSLLNELRRKLLDNVVVAAKNFELPVLPAAEAKGQSPFSPACFKVSLQMNVKDEITADKTRQWAVLPQICRQTKRLAEVVDALYQAGVRQFVAENYYAFYLLRKYKDIKLMAGSFIYLMNRYAAAQLKEMGVVYGVPALESSTENMQQLAAHSPLPLVQVVRAQPPLFTSAVCIRRNACRECRRGVKSYVLKKDGRSYRAVSDNCQIQVFGATGYKRDAVYGMAGVFDDETGYI